MRAFAIDSRGYAAQQRRFSTRAAARAAIVAGALLVAAVGVYWLASDSPVGREAPAAAAPARAAEPVRAAAEPLLTAPAATCVDGRPASSDVPADSCR